MLLSYNELCQLRINTTVNPPPSTARGKRRVDYRKSGMKPLQWQKHLEGKKVKAEKE